MQDQGFYETLAAPAAARHGIPLSWLLAFIGTETSFAVPAPDTWEPAVNEYAIGPLQILLSTAREIAPGISAAALADPATNLEIGAAYIRRLMDRYGSFERTYSAYNSGNPDRWTDSTSATAANVARAVRWLETLGGLDKTGWLWLVILGGVFVARARLKRTS